ncbi:MAG: bifunctional demethylmenaquinone methyltransferase/2-methoxy-6-polyprenyl-1,4-benzoquinol methylase UbiE [Planctomycetaceae bacterium]|nr:bifunctional demethylmenaquinone methyltransferase/2-methoxy-6-polyprenyl-1,4-benzoquinol methylase UbiE [Planctomycetaceae bacterium]
MPLDKSAQKIQRMFDSVAPKYDFLNHFLSLGIDRSWRRKTARFVSDSISELPDDAPILDVCCGTGDLCFTFERQLTGKRQVFGIDFSEKMLEIANRKSGAKNIGIVFQRGDAMNLPFEDNTFAAVSNAFGLRNTSDTQCSLSEMYRVCRKGGTVAVLEFSVPTVPLIRQCYLLYFRFILPVISRCFSKGSGDAYHYLPASVLGFDTPQQLVSRMEETGLTDCRIVPMTFGIVSLSLGRKG